MRRTSRFLPRKSAGCAKKTGEGVTANGRKWTRRGPGPNGRSSAARGNTLGFCAPLATSPERGGATGKCKPGRRGILNREICEPRENVLVFISRISISSRLKSRLLCSLRAFALSSWAVKPPQKPKGTRPQPKGRVQILARLNEVEGLQCKERKRGKAGCLTQRPQRSQRKKPKMKYFSPNS